MSSLLPTFATIALLGAFAAASGAVSGRVLLTGLTSLVGFAILALSRAHAIRSRRAAFERRTERFTTIAMLVTSSVVLFCCAVEIGRSGHYDRIAAVPLVVLLLAAMVRDARSLAEADGAHHRRGRQLVPLCGLALLGVAWLADGRLGFDREMEDVHASVTALSP